LTIIARHDKILNMNFISKHKSLPVFFAVLLLALIIRIYLLATHGCISDDGILYISLAESIAGGNWSTAFQNLDFNVFPVLLAGMYKLLNLFLPVSFEFSGWMLNLFFGLALLYPFFKITEYYFGLAAAIVAGLYLAFNPELCRMTCEVLREPSFLCFISWALFFVLTAVRSESLEKWKTFRFIAAGFFVMVAASIRPEAAGLFGVFTVIIFASHIKKGISYSFSLRFKKFIALIIIIPFLALPAIGGMKLLTGKWNFARFDKILAPHSLGKVHTRADNPLKNFANELELSIRKSDGKEDPDKAQAWRFLKMAITHRWINYGSEILAAHWKAFHGTGVVLFVAGILVIFKKRLLSWSSPLSVCALSETAIFGTVFLLYVSTKYYLATRHAMILVVPGSVFIGASVFWFKPYTRKTILAGIVTVIIILSFLIYKVSKPIRRKKRPMKQCGLILKKHLPADAKILAAATHRPVNFYAGKPTNKKININDKNVYPWFLKSSNRYLLINTSKQWQLDYFKNFTGDMQKVEIDLPQKKRYSFSLYELK